jgi:N-acetylmuramoyl-L-alanine amidase
MSDATDILARTIYGEARGEYAEGGIAPLIAVGNVVMNRVRAKGRYGNSIVEVCRQPFQFSCWNEGDPNRKLLMRPEIADPVFIICSEVAARVALGQWPDLTRGSDHYHAVTLPILPSWARNRKPRVRFGNHIFYQLI